MDQWTLLRQLIDDRGLSYPEVYKKLLRRAAALEIGDFALSERQLKRVINGQVKTRPFSGTRRVLEAEFGYPVQQLMGPATAAASSPADAGRPLHDAAAASAEFALWQPVDALAIAALGQALRQLVQDYVHGEMLPVVDQLVTVRERAVGLLPRAGGLQRSLYLIAGLSSAVLAHAAGNLGQLSHSPSHAQAAVRFAELGSLPGLAGWATAVLALQQEWSGTPRQSLVTARQARSYLPVGCGDSTAVWLASIEARAHARLGNAAGVLAALEVATRDREAMASAEPDEFGLDLFGGIVTFGPAKQHYYAGTALRRIGEHSRAREHASAAISAYERGPAHERSYGDETLARLDLAISYALGARADLDATAVALEPVAQLPQALLLPTLQGQLGELADALSAAPLSGSRQAARLRETAVALSASCIPRQAQITR